MRVLVVEDNAEMLMFLQQRLVMEGFEASVAQDGRAGLMLAATNDYEVLVVDRMLPKLDGIGMLVALRSIGVQTPAIFLTALDRVDERVRGLRSGADDYLVKPFEFVELTARINALARRNNIKPVTSVLRVDDLELDRLSQTVRRAGKPISLKPREYRLLEYLMQNAGKVVTRTMMLEAVWDFHFDPQTNLVESHISRVRAKIDQGCGRDLIQTVWGAGYRMLDASV